MDLRHAEALAEEQVAAARLILEKAEASRMAGERQLVEKAGVEQESARRIEATRIAWEKAETERVQGEKLLRASAETERLTAAQFTAARSELDEATAERMQRERRVEKACEAEQRALAEAAESFPEKSSRRGDPSGKMCDGYREACRGRGWDIVAMWVG